MQAAQKQAPAIPMNCIRCGKQMLFHSERYEPDDRGRPDHVRIYFCTMHGFFHYSDHKQVTAGM